ncbi:hypothetical protein QR680_006460 [Steinernema hermaphroditum]|uniref:Uncharacterized protein n=1 Tax=Steinernema hermaphroditum TaxID=289476 RepID=A0AA39LX65_9BILA|nr:hypothetical protein QR680_006460 [Steinernema hermaphroditum]
MGSKEASTPSTSANSTERAVVTTGTFSSNPPLQICSSTWNLAAIAFVIYVSMRIEKKDHSRLYMLWLFGVSVPGESLQIVISILQLCGIVDSSGNYYRDYIDVVQIVGKVLLETAAFVYRFLAIIMLVATFMSYAFPFTLARIFKPSNSFKRRKALYLGSFAFTVLFIIEMNAQTMFSALFGPNFLPDDLYDFIYFANQTIINGTSIILIVFCFLAIFVIISYSRRRRVWSNNAIKHRKQLLSIVLHTTLPNILNLTGLLINFCNIYIAHLPLTERFPSHPIIWAGGLFTKIGRYTSYARIPLLTISTFVAFDDFSNNPPLQICSSTWNLTAIAFVIYVSMKIDRKDHSRLYTLWLFVISAPGEALQIVISILQLCGIVDSSGNYYRDYVDVVQIVGRMLIEIPSFVYRLFAIIMVVATFMSYTFPLTLARIFKPSTSLKRRNAFYLGSFVFAVLLNMETNTLTMFSALFSSDFLPDDLYDFIFIANHTIINGTGIILIVFCFLSTFVIVSYSRRGRARSNSTSKHRKQLVSIILHTALPSILVLNGLLANFFNIYMASLPLDQRFPEHPIIRAGGLFYKIGRYTSYARIPLLSTFVAFGSYRRILLSMLPFRVTIIQVKVVGYNIRQSHSGNTVSTPGPLKTNDQECS